MLINIARFPVKLDLHAVIVVRLLIYRFIEKTHGSLPTTVPMIPALRLSGGLFRPCRKVIREK